MPMVVRRGERVATVRAAGGQRHVFKLSTGYSQSEADQLVTTEFTRMFPGTDAQNITITYQPAFPAQQPPA